MVLMNAPDSTDALAAEALMAATRIRVHAERVRDLRDALTVAYAHRLAAVREAHYLIAAIGPAEFSRLIGNRPDGRPLVHDTQLITWTRDLRGGTP